MFQQLKVNFPPLLPLLLVFSQPLYAIGKEFAANEYYHQAEKHS